MAASTWFQMSTCSPTVHGTAPEGSCMAAIEAAVSATCSLVRMPSTDGTSLSRSGMGHRGLGLAEVEHHALADQRVEHPAGQLQHPRLVDDLPDEQPVVGLHQRVLVVADADRALDPPV